MRIRNLLSAEVERAVHRPVCLDGEKNYLLQPRGGEIGCALAHGAQHEANDRLVCVSLEEGDKQRQVGVEHGGIEGAKEPHAATVDTTRFVAVDEGEDDGDGVEGYCRRRRVAQIEQCSLTADVGTHGRLAFRRSRTGGLRILLPVDEKRERSQWCTLAKGKVLGEPLDPAHLILEVKEPSARCGRAEM